MNSDKEKIKALNEIVGIIDSKASEFKADRFHMSEVKVTAEKKMINELINDAELLVNSMDQKPLELLSDLNKLRKSL